MSSSLLSVQNLKTHFFLRRGTVKAVDDVSFDIGRGEIVGLVGESGSGKSVTAQSIMRIVSFPGKTIGGKVLMNNENLLDKSNSEMNKIRGGKMSMIFQDPLSSLNPVIRVGDQIAEVVKLHLGLGKESAYDRVYKVMEDVGIVNPELRSKSYPFQFSGGMRQRIMIAMALSCDPEIIIADEPTTNLDVMVQAQILDLIKNLAKSSGISILLITHNLGIVAWLCDKVVVMYGGEIKEMGSTSDVFNQPMHPYTIMLMKCLPRPNDDRSNLEVIPGSVPDLIHPPAGCRFHPRCFRAHDDCSHTPQKLVEVENNHWVSCNYHGVEG